MVFRPWEKANRPISRGMKLMPPIRYTDPKVKRFTPPMPSTPMVASSRPMTPPMTPLMTDLPVRPATMLMPNTASAKYSCALNFRATLASRGAKMHRQMALNRPPNREARVEMPRARPG